jgi:hypothetical protein
VRLVRHDTPRLPIDHGYPGGALPTVWCSCSRSMASKSARKFP